MKGREEVAASEVDVMGKVEAWGIGNEVHKEPAELGGGITTETPKEAIIEKGSDVAGIPEVDTLEKVVKALEEPTAHDGNKGCVLVREKVDLLPELSDDLGRISANVKNFCGLIHNNPVLVVRHDEDEVPLASVAQERVRQIILDEIRQCIEERNELGLELSMKDVVLEKEMHNVMAGFGNRATKGMRPRVRSEGLSTQRV